MAIARNHELFKRIVKSYWEYYRELEDEFLQTRRYVDFSKRNYSTFSIEFLKLYQAVCSEIDVLGKAMASIADSSFKAEDKQNNILKWWFIIQNAFVVSEEAFSKLNPAPSTMQISLIDYKCFLLDDIEVIPWKGFIVEQRINKRQSVYFTPVEGSAVPSWWKDYNSVKHNRISLSSTMINYEKANLGNLIYAFSALYILEKAFLDTVGEKDDLQTFIDYSRLFDKQRVYTNDEMDSLFDYYSRVNQ